MRFRDHRQLLLKGIDVPDVPSVEDDKPPYFPRATPRWISSLKSGRVAAKIAEKELPERVPNRRDRRAGMKSQRRRVRGVALAKAQMPWKTHDAA